MIRHPSDDHDRLHLTDNFTLLTTGRHLAVGPAVSRRARWGLGWADRESKASSRVLRRQRITTRCRVEAEKVGVAGESGLFVAPSRAVLVEAVHVSW